MANNVNHPSFRAQTASTVNLSVGTSAVRVQVVTVHPTNRIRVYNSGANVVFIEFGPSGVTAAVATGIPIAAGATCIFSAGQDWVSAIASVAGPAVVYFTPGEGSLV